MKFFKYAFLVLLLSSSCAMAEPAKEESIRQLLTVTKAQELVNGMKGQINMVMNNVIQQSLAGKQPTAKEQKAIDNMKSKIGSLMQKELAWQTLEPMYVRLYRETFTEEEVAGMLSFYKTPSGQAVINKMPKLMHSTMGEMQKKMNGMMPQLQKIQQEFTAEMKGEKK